MKNIIRFIVLFLFANSLQAQKYQQVLDLEGTWHFTIGDRKEYASVNFDDNDWEKIQVPSSWEDEGFHGYNGYAWYRKKVYISSDYKNFPLTLNIGYIDDVDMTFFNGTLIGGFGSFPPQYKTAYDQERIYKLTNDIVKFDSYNVIAIRVYDAQLSGGILRGTIGIFATKNTLKPVLALDGKWAFTIGDDMQYAETKFNDSEWDKILVPSLFETQGYPDYDGIVWYRKKFTLPENIKKRNFVLLLGRIDDIDEVYLNGVMIGNTGTIESPPQMSSYGSEWQQFRGYYIPAEVLNRNGENTIAVRVYDGYINGGIYDGPIGLIFKESYEEYWKKRRNKDFWDIFGVE